jgi:hypothetical protein
MLMESDKPGFFQIIQDSFAYELLSVRYNQCHFNWVFKT